MRMECEYKKDVLSEGLVLARTRASDFENVKKLNFWGSGIRDVSVVKKLPNLEVCSLSVNSIDTLEDFAECENLKELFIRKNKIEDIKEICHLKTLPNLRNLWLADNPCDQVENYRFTVLKTLPKLQKLDNVAVTDEELKQADELGVDLSFEDDECNNEETKNKDLREESIKTNEENPEIHDKQAGDGDKTTLNVTNGKGKSMKNTSKEKSKFDPVVTMSWEETNKIREELGLKPLPIEKMTSPKPVANSKEKMRNTHVLQAVLILLKELDKDSLEIVQSTIQRKLKTDT